MTPDDARHGTYAGSTAHYKAGQKPCHPCYAARRKYHTRYSKERALGYVRRIPLGTGGIWQHIDDLYQCGYSYIQLSRALGCIGEARLYTIHRGGPQQPVAVKTWQALKDALTHVRAMPTQLGTLRRLQALHALGWPIKHVMDMTGLTPEIGKRALRGQHINFSAETRQSIAAVYERLCMTLPPTDAPRGVRAAITRARARSAAAGWVAPLGWDDIDHDAQPATQERIRPTRAEQLTDLNNSGYGITEVCRRLRIKPESLEKWCDRADMRPLFNELVRRERSAA